MATAISFLIPFHGNLSTAFQIHFGPSNATYTARTNTDARKANTLRAHQSTHDNSSSDEENRSNQTASHSHVVGDKEDKKIRMDVSPSVLRLLQGPSETQKVGNDKNNGVSLIERNQRKRAARMAGNRQTGPPSSTRIANGEEEISRAFQQDLPRLQKPGSEVE